MNNNFQIVKREVIKAYADCNNHSKEDRQLDFIASRPVSIREAQEIMSIALDGGYNNFTPDLLTKLPGDANIWIAREGSVCIYIDVPIENVIQIALNCDEYDCVTKEHAENYSIIQPMIGKYRIWWD